MLKQEYYLAFKGLGKRLPSSHYGDEIEICQEMHWGWEQLQAAPAEMVDEIRVRVEARAQVERERERQRGRR